MKSKVSIVPEIGDAVTEYYRLLFRYDLIDFAILPVVWIGLGLKLYVCPLRIFLNLEGASSL